MTDRLVDLGWQVVRYDIRGMGASQRDVTDFTLAARVRDLEAVIEHAGLRRFAVAGVDGAAGVAMAFASKHPEMVNHVVALNAWADGRVRYNLSPISRVLGAIEGIAERDWDFFTMALAKLVTELDNPQHTLELAGLFRRSATPQTHNAIEDATAEFDLSPVLSQLTMPVLVVHDTGFPFGSLDLCNDLAARTANSSLIIIKSDRDAEVEAIDSYLRWGADTARAVPPEDGRGPPSLTPREAEILRLVAAGRTNREISAELVLSLRTVARHITNMYGKIGARSKADATAYAFRHNLT
jgi:pimeloyl-ACP methyl ester carboxylesterase/DNA-binding CsgD family transcriptional regulator